MNWKKIIAIIAGIALVAAFVFKLKSNKDIATEKIYHYDKEQPINVSIQNIKLEDISQESSYVGNFGANRETKLSAETQGKINHISVNEGDFVRKGQKLIQLDNALLLRKLNVLEVQSQNAEVEYNVQLNANQIQIDGLRKDVNRYSILQKSDAIQGVQLEKAEMQLKTAENQRTAIIQQSGIKSLDAQRESIEEQINKTTIKAPFSGIVTMKFTEIGGFAAPGMPLLQITDLDKIKFTINVSENELSQFEIGKSYEVVADIYPNQSLTGRTTLIGSKANMGGSYPVQFTLKNMEGAKIKAGMFGKLAVSNKSIEKGFSIPASAIIGSAAEPQVYLIKDGKAKLQTISISKKIQNKAIVSTGIKEGDILIINGLINLFDGANVSFN